ncbi:RVP domain-containing protein, partial [Cephalotus follicularis]
EKFINLRITYQNWNIKIIITIQDSFKLQTIALIDSGAETNCIQEELIPTKFFEKTEQELSTAKGESLSVKFKISDVHICNEGIYIKQSFILVKDNLGIGIILGQQFLGIIKPFKVTNEGITTKLFQQKILFTFNKKSIIKEVNLLKTLSIFKEHSINLVKDLSNKKFEQQLPASQIKEKINPLRNNIINNFCSDAFWHKKRHMVSLPYQNDFTEQNHCKKEIQELLNKKLIRPSKSPSSYAAFDLENQKFIINYKPLH